MAPAAQDELEALGTTHAEREGRDDDVEAVLQENGECASITAPADLIARAVDDWAREKLSVADDDGDIHEQLEAIVEAALLRRTLREVRGNQLEAARRLGINRNTLRKRLGQLEIDPAHP